MTPYIQALCIYAFTSGFIFVVNGDIRHYNGTSPVMPFLLHVMSFLGTLACLGFFISLFFHHSFSWYEPITIALLGMIASVIMQLLHIAAIRQNVFLFLIFDIVYTIGIIVSIMSMIMFCIPNVKHTGFTMFNTVIGIVMVVLYAIILIGQNVHIITSGNETRTTPRVAQNILTGNRRLSDTKFIMLCGTIIFAIMVITIIIVTWEPRFAVVHLERSTFRINKDSGQTEIMLKDGSWKKL